MVAQKNIVSLRKVSFNKESDLPIEPLTKLFLLPPSNYELPGHKAKISHCSK